MSQRTETEVNSVDLRVQNSIRVQVNRFSSPFNGEKHSTNDVRTTIFPCAKETNYKPPSH
jgi:hypothetical protein